MSGPEDGAATLPCPLGWRDARCGRFGERGPCGCEPPLSVVADATAGEEPPYMLENSPAEFERVRAVAARRHREEVASFAARSGGAQDDGLREALRIHHPIMRSETGPFSGCRCGAVKLGQDVIAHVVTELRRALAGPDDTQQDGVG